MSIQLTARPAAFVLGTGLLVSLVWIALVVARDRRRRQLAAIVAAAVEQVHRGAREYHRQFLDRLDHELKNPVTAIRAAVAAHAQGNGDHLAIADAQAVRVAVLVADLRKLAEMQTSQLELAPVDLAALVHEVVTGVRGELDVAGSARDLRVHFPAARWPVPAVTGDSDLLYLALYNVVSNARKFTMAGDLIEVSAGEGDSYVDIDVADTGRGIPPGEVEGVWEELSRASNARSVAGSGLGMPMVRTIVERHGGSVSLRSRLGEGTSVRLRLPTGRPQSHHGKTCPVCDGGCAERPLDHRSRVSRFVANICPIRCTR